MIDIFKKSIIIMELDDSNQFMRKVISMTLNEAEIGKEYVIKAVNIEGDEDVEAFLFSLGCYSGEPVTVVDKKKNLVIAVKDARYNIDPELAETIEI